MNNDGILQAPRMASISRLMPMNTFFGGGGRDFSDKSWIANQRSCTVLCYTVVLKFDQ